MPAEPVKKCHLIPALRSDSKVFSLHREGLMCNIPPKSQMLEKSNVLRAEVTGKGRLGKKARQTDRQTALNVSLRSPVF